MAKTETQIDLKINKGTYAKIQENLSQIGEDELIITDDKNIPVPVNQDEGKVLYVNNGDYALDKLSNVLGIEVNVAQLGEGTTTISLTQEQENTLLLHSKEPTQIIVRIGTDRYYFYKEIETETVERYTCITPTTSALYSYMLQYTKNSGELVLYDSVEVQLKNLITDIETHKAENGSYPSTKAVYDYCQTLGVDCLLLTITKNQENSIKNYNTISIQLTQEQKDILNNSFGKEAIIILTSDVLSNLTAHSIFKKYNEKIYDTTYTMRFSCNGYGFMNNATTIIHSMVEYNGNSLTFQRDEATPQVPQNIEVTTHKKTSVQDNLSSDTYYPTTKAVYDFVKGETKYIIVSDYSALPTTNVSTGMLAYCQTIDNQSHEAGFYQYKNNTWNYVELENIEPINVTITGNFDVSQTYTFTIDSDDMLPLLKGATLVIGFTGGGSSIFRPDFFQTGQTTYTSSAVVVLNNTQYIATIDFDLSVQNNNATLSFSEIEGGSGGGEAVGGSGKLYEWKATISFYDTNGKKNTFAGTDIDFSFLMYESNWERFKVLAQAKGITFNQPSDLTTLINTTLNETTSSQTADVLSMFMFLCTEVDKVLLKGDLGTGDYLELEMFALWTLAPLLQCANDDLSIVLLDVNDAPLGINCDNSCTLTEYGTSGSGGGSGATRTKYHIEVADSNGCKAIIPIYQDTFEDYLVEINQAGQTLATVLGITWTTITDIDGLKDTFDDLKTGQLSYGCDLAMNLLVKYAYESGENPVFSISYLLGNRKIFSVQSLLTYNLANNFLGGVLSIDDETMEGNGVLNWFKNTALDNTNEITIDQDATFTYTEEQVASSGSSSSSQPTIPERFSLAYNLVVNINQEQFANGSWTGSNSDNIRTFQYNGSNADQAKATELVEFLTGVPVLDEYNATKPTPCFVFCTQSNICWKLQWESNGLKAYQVNNFPFVVKKKYYNFVLQDSDGANSLSLQINIPYETMQDVYDSINQVLGGNISTPQEVIAVYDSLKADNIQSQQYGMLIQLFGGLAQYCLYYNLSNIIGNMDGAYKVTGASAFTGILYNGNNELFSITSATGKISFTSNSTLVINEYDSDRLD